MGADLLDRLRSQLDWTSEPKQPGASTQPGTHQERMPAPAPVARPASTLLGGAPSGLGANVDVRGQGFQSPAAGSQPSDASYGRCGPGSEWGFLGDVYTPECLAHDAAVRGSQESGTSKPMSHIKALPLLPSAIGSYAREVTGASGDVRADAGVQAASGRHDLRNGTASGEFSGAHAGVQLDDANVNALGRNVAIPNMGAEVRASGGGSVDLARGAAQGNVGLGGSSVNFGGTRVTLPESAQASGGVDLSQGAANAQLGGANGVGANMNISQGQLEVNALGHKVDVAGGVRRGANAIGDAASNLWNAIPDVKMPRLW
jgi:hypothetical protein